MLTTSTTNSFRAPKSYRDFRETGSWTVYTENAWLSSVQFARYCKASTYPSSQYALKAQLGLRHAAHFTGNRRLMGSNLFFVLIS